MPDGLFQNISIDYSAYNNGILKSVSFDSGDSFVNLELITTDEILRRSDLHWVYHGTGEKCVFSLNEDVYQNIHLYNPTYINGILVSISLPANGQNINLEQVSTQTLIQRSKATTEVAPITSGQAINFIATPHLATTPQLSAFSEGAFKNSSAGYIQREQNHYDTEISPGITQSFNSNPDNAVIIQLSMNINTTTNQNAIVYNRGAHQINVSEAGSGIILEEVGATALNQHSDLHWVYPGTGIEYHGPFPEDLCQNLNFYNPIYNEKGKLVSVAFYDGRQVITLEQVTARTLSRRADLHWVYLSTGIEYHGPFPEDLCQNLSSYHPTYNEKGRLVSISFYDGEKSVPLEHVSAATLRYRKPIWVYPETSIEYQGVLPEDLNQNLNSYKPTYKGRKLVSISFQDGDESIKLEVITKRVLKRRIENSNAAITTTERSAALVPSIDVSTLDSVNRGNTNDKRDREEDDENGQPMVKKEG
ncbi:hypothetical protein [Legionella tunisiensis]|uniref:hypothetical protein n=1 Tax=Legionella tunisiensis TaxID=1034944 RepID=UPI0012EA936B|nr:hypothetical protein [Legionella tunisiensis]